MSNQRPTSHFTFTPAETEPVESNMEPQQAQQEEFDWERGLEKLREQRQAPANIEPAHTDIHIAPAEPIRQSEPAARQPDNRELNQAAREKVLREYLQQWQQEHNEAFNDEETNTAETDTTVLLQEDWLSAQGALHTAAEEHVQATRTVWLNPKRRPMEAESAETETQSEDNEQGDDENLIAASGQIPVTVQVINPQVSANMPVMCLSETELMERLTKRLRPHLTDAVAGMVRTAVQKQAAALTYQLQQNLNEQTPALVDEILEYNLKAVMSEIRYDLKFKRN